jgi:hypothetical protein
MEPEACDVQSTYKYVWRNNASKYITLAVRLTNTQLSANAVSRPEATRADTRDH